MAFSCEWVRAFASFPFADVLPAAQMLIKDKRKVRIQVQPADGRGSAEDITPRKLTDADKLIQTLFMVLMEAG
jgi:hypothetical protein